MKVSTGQVVGASTGKGPIEYLHGSGQILPALERALEGLCLYARASGGQSYPITVKEIREEMVVVDLNHPLAGERLFFEVKICGVRPAGNHEIFSGKAAQVETV